MSDDYLIPSDSSNPDVITLNSAVPVKVSTLCNYNTFLTVTDAISKAKEFPFRLEESEIEGRTLDARLKSKDYLSLACTKLLADGTPCGHNVSHTVGNILHAMKTPGHLRCQGHCDSKKKGKARRKKFDQAAVELALARGGTWTILPETYRRNGKKVQLVHVPCGGTVHRKLSHALDFPTRAGLPAITDADCPYCTERSARPALGGDPNLYSAWLSTATRGSLAYRSGSLAPEDRETVPLEVECTVCGSVFFALESQLILPKFYGCKQCVEKNSHQQRAWVLTDAQKVVARRGLVLEGNPCSYTAPARIVSENGELSGYPDILSLVRALPAKADGFGRPEQPAWDTANTGLPYTAEDESFIRTAHRQKRSKPWLCRKLRRTLGSMNQKCKRLGLQFNGWEHVNRRIIVNDQFFTELSVRSAYWAGLLAADGCVSKDVTIELKVVDEVVLQQFMSELGHTGVLMYRTMANVDGRGLYAALRFRSRQITDDLREKYRITPRKSLTLGPPELKNTEHILAYICGLFEGDGHIKISERNGLMAQICTGSLELINWLQQMMLGLEVKCSFRQVDTQAFKLYELTWCGGNAERLLNALTGAVDGAMDRKWKVFTSYLEAESAR